jgi:hypothetical protein
MQDTNKSFSDNEAIFNEKFELDGPKTSLLATLAVWKLSKWPMLQGFVPCTGGGGVLREKEAN